MAQQHTQSGGTWGSWEGWRGGNAYLAHLLPGQSQFSGRGSDPGATGNMAVIPGWEESGSSQENHPTGEELAEVLSGGDGMGGTGGSMKVQYRRLVSGENIEVTQRKISR